MDRLATIFLCAVTVLRPGNSLFATNKLSLASWGSYDQREHKGFGTYSYGYDIEDPVTGNVQFKQEERHPNGTVVGSYGYVDASGRPRVTHYVSDVNGYRVVDGKQVIPERFTAPDPPKETEALLLPVHQLFYPSDNNRPQGNEVTTGMVQSQAGNRVQNNPPIIYQFQGLPPFFSYHTENLPPISLIFKRK